MPAKGLFREIFIFMLPLAQIHPPLPTLVPDMCMALKKANSLLFGNFLFEFFISIKNFGKNESWKVPKYFGHNRVAPYFHHFFKFKHTFRRFSKNKPFFRRKKMLEDFMMSQARLKKSYKHILMTELPLFSSHKNKISTNRLVSSRRKFWY